MAEEKVGLRFVVDGRQQASSAFRSVRSDLLSVKNAAIGTGAAVAGVGFALKGAFEEARESERVGKVTENRLRSTAWAARTTSTEIGNLANAISLKTGIDDEAIQSSANMLLMFTKVRNEQGRGNDIFNRATQAITDYAAAMGNGKANADLDLTSAARAVGKALNDPIKGTNALAKAGVGFTKAEKDKIKALVTSGHELDAQRLLLDKLKKSQGGTAEANATLTDKMSTAWANINEQLGLSLLPTLDRLEGKILKDGVPAITHYLDVFEKRGIPAIGDFVDKAEPLARELLPTIGTALGTTADALKVAAPYARDLVNAFNDAPQWVKTGLALGAGGAYLRSKLPQDKSPISKALSKYGGATPVFVVNEGMGGLPDSGGGSPRRRRGAPGRARTRGSKAGAGGALGLFAGSLLFDSILTNPYVALAALLNETATGSQGPDQQQRFGKKPFLSLKDYSKLRDAGGTGNWLNTVLFEPARVAQEAIAARARKENLRDLYSGTMTAANGVDRLAASLAVVDGTKVDIDTGPARASILALNRDLTTALNSLLSPLLGGSTPGAPGRRPPRVPSAPPSKPRTPQPSGAGRTSREQINLSAQLVLPDGRVISDLVVGDLRDQEARR
ncbi:hypothetical protein K8Z61_18550 [Nocardioides sp. TRM66260-LWL]|uniref:hypothetical protein n=1 Tax=Nocardioides sp. TRM66260-LWL TaxID=2874478 RepID=UPI001CC5A3C6|nr:hypothetical protein [Nocardioides sp. TRM66260-LWL]MBZ5736496.1 hypothetical protein [Nocardioides sp. TRM66260-LWL]